MPIKYVGKCDGKYKTTFKKEKDGKNITLIWGDPVHVTEGDNGKSEFEARGHVGSLDTGTLTDTNDLLEIYVIDVGQGDGVLIKTPDSFWHLIDGGNSFRGQDTRKSAANFVRWKFIKDLKEDTVKLENVIMSHPDHDHFGGLIDVLSGTLAFNKHFDVEVMKFYHSGIGRFRQKPKLGKRVKGKVDPFPQGNHGKSIRGSFIAELLDDEDSFKNPSRPFTDDFSKLADLVATVPGEVKRLTHKDRHLTGYRPGDNAVTIRVLGPVMEDFRLIEETGSGSGLRWLSNDPWTKNGNSIVLRIEYGACRILLTGDLNNESQKVLLSYFERDEFAVDVAKGCHHGAEDINMEFVKAMNARATVVSSGDNESYAHPRPVALGGSARYGREAVGINEECLPPLLYSTELARSIKYGWAESTKVNVDRKDYKKSLEYDPFYVQVKQNGEDEEFRWLKLTMLAKKLVYGLVNVRTDGKDIMFATMHEQGHDFDVKVIKAGKDPEKDDDDDDE